MSRPLRVAVVAACPYPWPRGTPIRIHQMALALAARGHDVHVVSYHLGEALDASAGLTVHRIDDVSAYRRTAPGPTPRKLLQLDPMLAALLGSLHREVAFDAVHAHHYEGVLVAARAGGSTPIVYDAHTTLAGELPQYRLGIPKGIARRIGRALDRRLPRLAQHTIAVSDGVRDALVSLGAVPAHRIDVVPNGIEWELFDDLPQQRSGDRFVVFAGNLAPYQRVDLLLRAFAELRRSRADVRLLVLTESAFAPHEALARALGVRDSIDVRDAPFREQPALLARASVAVNPRVECDGLPQKLLNYMAAGVPVVSFEGSAVHLEHGRTGLRVPNGDTRSMAAAIGQLLDQEELATRLGSAAREQVRRDFSWSAVAERVEGVYRKLLPTSSSIGLPTK